jgi:hypothetical protein
VPNLHVSVGVVGRMTLVGGVALLGVFVPGVRLFDKGSFAGFCGGFPMGAPATGLTLVFELGSTRMALLEPGNASRVFK